MLGEHNNFKAILETSYRILEAMRGGIGRGGEVTEVCCDSGNLWR